MKEQKTFKIRDIMQVPILIARDSANIIFANFDNESSIKINTDFSNVEFISRSFADQFYKNKIAIRNKKDIEIVMSNCNNVISEMFKEVAKTNNPDFVRHYGKTKFHAVSISSIRDLQRFNFSF